MEHSKNTGLMSRTAEYMSGLTMVYCCAAMAVWMLSLLPVNASGAALTLRLFPVILLPGVFYLLNAGLMERKVHLSLLLILDILLGAACFALFWTGLTITPEMPVTRLAFTVLFLLSLGAALYIAWDPVRSGTVIGCFDWMVVLLIVYLAMQKQNLTLLPVQVPALCAFAMALSFVTMIRIRLDRTGASGASVGNAGAGRILFAVLIVLIAGAAVLIAFAASGMLHGLSTAVWAAASAAGSAALLLIGQLYRLLEAAVLWLLQWLPGGEIEGDGSETAAAEETSASAEMAAGAVPMWFYVLIAVLAAALVLFLLYRLRRIRMDKRTGTQREADAVRTGGLKQALLLWIAAVRARVTLMMHYRRKKKTPAGMLFWCERHFRRSCPRRAGESGEAYLRRLADAPAGEAAAEPLRELADRIERAFYAPEGADAAAGDPDLYRRLRAARTGRNPSETA